MASGPEIINLTEKLASISEQLTRIANALERQNAPRASTPSPSPRSLPTSDEVTAIGS